MSQTNIAFGGSNAQAFGPGGASAETHITQSNHGGAGEQSNLAFGISNATGHGYGPAHAVTEIHQANEAGGWGYHEPQTNLAFGASNAEGGGFPWGGCFPHGGPSEAYTQIDQSNDNWGSWHPSCEPISCEPPPSCEPPVSCEPEPCYQPPPLTCEPPPGWQPTSCEPAPSIQTPSCCEPCYEPGGSAAGYPMPAYVHLDHPIF